MAAKKKTVAKTSVEGDTTVKERPAAKAKKKSTVRKKVAKKAAVSKEKTENTAQAEAKDTKKVVPGNTSATGATVKIRGDIPTTDGSNFKTFVPYEPAKDEEYMSPEQTEHFRAILLNWKISLMEEVDRTVGHMKSDATNFPDPNDRATQEEEFSLELRTRDRERKLIKKIDDSLTKLDEEDYGYCDGCGVEIGIRRLEARPTATMCIECKTLEEIREKQIA